MSTKSKHSSTASSPSASVDLERAASSTEVTEKPSPSTDAVDDPLNWPAWKRHYHTLIPALAALVCTIASSIYTPAIRDVAADLSVSNEVALLPFSLYILGLGFGPLLGAPVSEHFGRRVVYLGTLPVFALFTMGAALAPNIETLTILRFFAGVFAGPSLVIGSGSIADLYRPADRAIPMTVYIATPFCGPAVAPLIGGYATQQQGWRWTMWATLIMAGVAILVALPMRETSKTAMLKKRNRGVEQESLTTIYHNFITTSLRRPGHMAATEPIVTLTMVYIGINFATLYSFFAAFPDVLEQAYGFDTIQTGLSFLAIGVGALTACLFIVAVDRYVFKREARHRGKVTPERRLVLAMTASLLLPSSLFWFAWTAKPGIHWLSPIIAEAFFSCGNMLAFMSFVLYLSDTYGAAYTASAMTANTFLRYLLGASFPLWITYMYQGLGTGWATSVLGFLSLIMTPVPWIFAWYGPQIRARSSY